MIVLGIDPGLNITGYAVLESTSPDASQRLRRPAIVDAGVVRTSVRQPLARRINEIYCQISDILEEHKVQLVAVEKLYSHYAHPRTAILMAHARGAVLLAAAMAGVDTLDLSATLVKKFLTGFGHAGKPQVGRAVSAVFGWKKAPSPPDVCDAIAIALTALAKV